MNAQPLKKDTPITNVEKVKEIITEAVNAADIKEQLLAKRVARQVFQKIILEGIINPTPEDIQNLVNDTIIKLI